jgi:hypothetical protein
MLTPIITLTDYLRDRKWLYYCKGLTAEWEILHKIALSVPPAVAHLGDGNMLTDYGVDLVQMGVHNSGQAGDPPTLFRP